VRLHEFRFYYFTPLYDQTVTFYRDVLGFEVFNAWDRGAADRGTIFRSPNGAGLIEIEAGMQMPSILGGFYIEVDDVGKWYKELQRR
jgi:catechol 2,3-dioxygenase-like lactoylglutathione lyase family enzyme